MRYVFLIGCILIVVFVFRSLESKTKFDQFATATPAPQSLTIISRKNARVSRVYDGDTFELETGAKVRLIGIDAPEYNKDSSQCYGDISYKIAKELLEGQTVELEKDTSETDKYNRLLRYVYQDGVFINQLFVGLGYAKILTIAPDTRYASDLITAQQQAKSEKRGLWKECFNGQ